MHWVSTWSFFSNFEFQNILLISIFDIITVTNLVFQYGQQKHELQEFLNHHNNCSIMQSDIKLKDELLKKKSIECNLLESLNRDQNRLYSKTKTVLDFLQHTGMLQGKTINTELHYYLLFILWKIWRSTSSLRHWWSLASFGGSLFHVGVWKLRSSSFD